MMQQASHFLMIQPVNFGYNAQTAVNNAFQKSTGHNIREKALQEFNDLVTLLHNNKVEVTVIEDSQYPATPDSVFPNNWISFHGNGQIFLYPMFAENRRLERKDFVLNLLQHKFLVAEIIDLSHAEKDGLFLEGTGSMVLDREHKIAYACLSPRTSTQILDEFCEKAGYTPFTFSASDCRGIDIYHTNVMMCVAGSFVVICLDSVGREEERTGLISSIGLTGKEIIPISLQQLDHFAGNMLQVKNIDDELLLVMSTQAYRSLTPEQIIKLQSHNRIIHSPLETIEMAGGGSARCMIAEVFLEKK